MAWERCDGPPERAGGGGWGEECLCLAAPASSSWISERKWKDGQIFYVYWLAEYNQTPTTIIQIHSILSGKMGHVQ